MKHRWLLPLRFALPVAVVLGCVRSAGAMRANDYLRYGLYYTATRMLSVKIDRYAVLALVAFYILFAAVFLLVKLAVHAKPKTRLTTGTSPFFSWTRITGLLISNSFIIVFLGLNISFGALYLSNIIANRGRPNVILIITDACRADHLGCYGYSRNTSPNIDNLAKEGIRFSNAVAQAPWTRWSIASFLTSTYPETMNLRTHMEVAKIDDRYLTFAEALKDHGYRTSAVVSNIFLSPSSTAGFSHGYDHYDDSLINLDDCSPAVTDHALDQLRKLAGGRFFLTVHYMKPHEPYQLHKQFNFDPNYKGKVKSPFKVWGWNDLAPLSQDDRYYVQSLYDSEIRFMDYNLGHLLSWLKKKNLYRNTLIIVVSDHGEEFMDHGHDLHEHTLYHELLHVPCIIKLPGSPHGVVSNATFPMIDLLPSVLNYIGCDSRQFPFQGNSVDLSNPNNRSEDYVFSAIDGFWRREHPTPISYRSVQYGRYKLIKNLLNGYNMLFDLKADPAEKHNILSHEPRVCETLNTMLLAHKQEMDKDASYWSTAAAPNKFTGQERERLRSLGYAQ